MNCSRCGRCCQEMFFKIDLVSSPGGLDHLEWAKLHNLKIEYRHDEHNQRWWGITLAQPCSRLRQEADGRFSCAAYGERPQMCRDYYCS